VRFVDAEVGSESPVLGLLTGLDDQPKKLLSEQRDSFAHGLCPGRSQDFACFLISQLLFVLYPWSGRCRRHVMVGAFLHNCTATLVG